MLPLWPELQIQNIHLHIFFETVIGKVEFGLFCKTNFSLNVRNSNTTPACGHVSATTRSCVIARYLIPIIYMYSTVYMLILVNWGLAWVSDSIYVIYTVGLNGITVAGDKSGCCHSTNLTVAKYFTV